MRAIVVSILLAALALSNTACIGRMAVSGQVLKFNLNVVEGKWGREIAMVDSETGAVQPLGGDESL